jgi:amino acid permease
MKESKNPDVIILFSLALMLLLVSPGAFAYLDPSTGSMVVSAIVGIIASIALALKTYWYRIKAFLRRDGKKDSSSQQPPE